MSTKDASARKNEQIIVDLLKEEANKHCADCGQKGTRWASWNLGVFLCIRCGGLHRKLGTHISKVKSVNLDRWTDDQVQNMVEKGNAKVNAIYNPTPDRFPFPAYSGDMEQYIRDKYERRLFMSSDARGRIDDGGQTTTSRASLSAASLPASAMERYPLQQKSLQEMGFTNPTANATALHASKGNLQEAIEALLATKRGSPTEEIPPKSTISPKATSPADDLVDIFGAMPPPSKSSSVSQLPPSTSQSTSILDLDLPPPPTATATGEASDEFEDFESAKYVPPPQEPTRRKPSLPEELDDATAPPKFTPPMKNISSVAPDLSNPWASGNSGHGDAFDDIDPFRGFTSKNH